MLADNHCVITNHLQDQHPTKIMMDCILLHLLQQSRERVMAPFISRPLWSDSCEVFGYKGILWQSVTESVIYGPRGYGSVSIQIAPTKIHSTLTKYNMHNKLQCTAALKPKTYNNPQIQANHTYTNRSGVPSEPGVGVLPLDFQKDTNLTPRKF